MIIRQKESAPSSVVSVSVSIHCTVITQQKCKVQMAHGAGGGGADGAEMGSGGFVGRGGCDGHQRMHLRCWGVGASLESVCRGRPNGVFCRSLDLCPESDRRAE